VTVYNKNVSIQCNLPVQIEQVQDNYIFSHSGVVRMFHS